MRKLVRAIVVLVLITGVLSFLLVEQEPITSNSDLSNTQKAGATDLLKRINQHILSGSDTTLEIDEDDLNGIMRLGTITYPIFHGQVKVNTTRAIFKYSIQIADTGLYLNIRSRLTPSDQGLNWSSSKIGKIPIPSAATNYLFTATARQILGREDADNLLSGVQQVEMSTRKMLVHYTTPVGADKGIARATHKFLETNGKNINGQKVQYYLDRLIDFQHKKQPQPLANVLSYLIAEAYVQTQSQKNDPAVENTAAIIALGIHVEKDLFRHFVVDIDISGQQEAGLPDYRILDRPDLAKHFVYSAVLHLLADENSSIEIGEFKEMLDTEPGQSGFSFTDLAANRAGVKFSKTASENPQSALLLQTRVFHKGLQESAFFPSIADLPEGLSEQEFRTRYKNRTSASFQKVVTQIDERLNQKSLYSLTL